jgi:hypothetical protein
LRASPALPWGSLDQKRTRPERFSQQPARDRSTAHPPWIHRTDPAPPTHILCSCLPTPKSHHLLLPYHPITRLRLRVSRTWWAHGAAKKKQQQQQLHRRTPREHSPPSSPAALRATLTSTCDRERELGRGPPSPNPTAKQLPAARREDTHVVVTGDSLHRLQLLQVGAAPPRPFPSVCLSPLPAPLQPPRSACELARLPLVPAPPPFAHRLVVVVVVGARPPGYTKPTLLDTAARPVCMPARSPGTRVVARRVPPLSPLHPWLG